MFKLIAPALVAASLTALAGAALAHEYKAGALSIGHPWSRATAEGVKIGGGFLTVTNSGAEPDRLVRVVAPFAEKTELHESTVTDGVARMRPLADGVEIKPGEKVEFAPGGKHVMFIGLKAPLTKGERVKGALVFERAGEVAVEFAVEAAGGKPEAMDHSAHEAPPAR